MDSGSVVTVSVRATTLALSDWIPESLRVYVAIRASLGVYVGVRESP
jgi:hypothetical protein